MKSVFATAFIGLLILLGHPAQGQENVASELVQRIERAKATLESRAQAINKEKQTYADRLSRAESEVRRLRNRAAGIQREADEKLLSLQQLQTRLNQWQDQRDYQNHLLERHGQSIFDHDPQQQTMAGADVLAASVQRLEESLQPAWKNAEIAMPSGEFVGAHIIRVGPARLFYAPEVNASGMYEAQSGQYLQSYYSYTGGAHSQIKQLATLGAGSPLFDPTQGRAIEIANHQETFWGHLQKGGFWIAPIVLFGAAALLIAVFKLVQLTKLQGPPQSTRNALDKLLSENTPQAHATAQELVAEYGDAYKRLVNIILKHKPSQKRDDLLLSHVHEQRKRVTSYLDVIALTAAVAPLLGLLGTVSGMIKTFKMLTIFGSGDPAAISGGISEALVTTELGLIVAIPALVMNAFLSRKAKAYMHGLEETAVALSTRDA